MKKALVALLVLSLASVGAETALAAIPHVHDGDFDHSHHGTCPVHLAALHGVDQLHAAAAVIPVSETFSNFRPYEAVSEPASAEPAPASSRAPPASV